MWLIYCLSLFFTLYQFLYKCVINKVIHHFSVRCNTFSLVWQQNLSLNVRLHLIDWHKRGNWWLIQCQYRIGGTISWWIYLKSRYFGVAPIQMCSHHLLNIFICWTALLHIWCQVFRFPSVSFKAQYIVWYRYLLFFWILKMKVCWHLL